MPFTNSRLIATANETQEQTAITFSRIDHQIGGNGAIDVTQRLQTLIKTLDSQAASLEEAVSNITLALSGILGTDLAEKATYLTQEKDKDEATNRSLRKLIDVMKNEQSETNALLDHVLEQRLSPILQPSILHETQPPTLLSSSLPSVTSPNHTRETFTGLSSYQQGLFSRKNQIGNKAWKLLGGKNTSLAAALSNSIQQNPGMVEILSLEKNSFTLRVNGKEQDQLYKF